MRFRMELLARLTMQEIRRRHNSTILLCRFASVLRPACDRLVSKVRLDIVFVVHPLTKLVPCNPNTEAIYDPMYIVLLH